MKKVKFFVIIFILLNFCHIEGGIGFSFLDYPLGAKAVSLAGSFVSLADDISCIYWNSAGLTKVRNKEWILGSNLWFENSIYRYYFGIAENKKGFGYIGLLLDIINNADIEKRTEEIDEEFDLISVYDIILNISFSKKITKTFSFGTTIKFIYENLDTESLYGLAIDFGILKNIERLSLGISIKNIGLQILESNSISYDQLPTSINFGISKEFKKIILLTDIYYGINSKNLSFGLSGEYKFTNNLSLRLGGRYKTQQVENFNLSIGFGVKQKNYKLNYAFTNDNMVGIIHRIDIVKNY